MVGDVLALASTKGAHMNIREMQVTPKSAPKLMKLLKALAERGPVKVRITGDMHGIGTVSGLLTCEVKLYPRRQVIECKVDGYLMPISITPRGYIPKAEDETTAYFRVKQGQVSIRYQLFSGQSGFRIFESDKR